MIKPVRQEDSMGCGIACAAFVTGKSYQETKNELSKTGKRHQNEDTYIRRWFMHLKKWD